MIVFYILLFVPMMMQFVASCRTDDECQKKSKNSLLFFFMFVTVLVALRHESVGSDTRNYINHFQRFSSMSWEQVKTSSMEIGFAYFNKIISVFTKNIQIYLAITAIISFVMIYRTYKRLCEDSSLTIVLYIIMSTFVMAFSGIRQMLAVSIGFLAYECVCKKKFVPFVIATALAMTFHTSAFMIAFMYPVYHAKITKKWLLAIVPLLVVTFVYNETIFEFLSVYIERYTKYDAEISSTGAYTMLILFVMLTVFAFVIPDESKMDAETVGLRNFLIVALALQMFVPLHTLAMRMNYYYIIFIPLLIPKIIQYSKKEMRQLASLARFVMVMFFIGYFFYSAYTSDSNLNVFPYHFFWENVI